MNTGGKLYFPGSSDRIDQLQYISVIDGKQNTYLGQDCGNKFPGELNVFSGYQSGQDSRQVMTSVFSGAKSGQNAQRLTDTVLVGHEAGQSSSDSNSNVLIGAYAGRELQRSRFNVAVGHRSMASLVSGVQNTAVGAYAATSASSLANSVTIGFYSGEHLRGSNSTYIGAFSGSNARSYDATVIGFQSGQHLVGNAVTAMGKSVLGNGSSVNDSVAIGTYVGENLINSGNVVAIGSEAMRTAVGATNVVAIGSRVAYHALDIDGTVILGYRGAESVIKMRNGVGIGYDVLGDAIGTIIDCVILGSSAAYKVSGVMGTSVVVGHTAAFQMESMYDSTIIGCGAGSAATMFEGVTAIGSRAMESTVNADFSTAVGTYCFGGSSSTGTYNSFMGYYCGLYAQGNFNTAMGAYTAQNLHGDRNVVIGSNSVAQSGDGMQLVSNSILIGHFIEPETMETCVVIGNSIVPYPGSSQCILMGSDMTTDLTLSSKTFYVAFGDSPLIKVNVTDAEVYCPDATPGNVTVVANVVNNDTTWTGGLLLSNGGLQVHNGIKAYGPMGSVYAQNRLVAGKTEYNANMADTRLYINGNGTVTGFLQKGGGTFDIQHPINPSKRLIHSFIEGPRCDLVYRGTVALANGKAQVAIDTASVANADCAMTVGTFEALVANPDVYLQNQTGFARVRGWVDGGTLFILSEHTESSDTVSWMVVGERKDPLIREWNRTNAQGYLQTEYTT